MYAQIEKLVTEKPGITCSHLLREAKNAASSIGKPARNGKPQPWRKTELFVEKLLTVTDALLDKSGTPIGRGIRAKTATVDKLADSWQEKADAEIILRLVDLVHDLGHDDHENLAGVLYLKRDQDACDRIEAILRNLVVDAGKLEEKEVDGRVVYGRASQPPEAGHTGLRVAQ